MNFEDLKNPELQEKLKSAKTAEELVALAKEEGIDLSDEQLAAFNGGEAWYEFDCPDNYCDPGERYPHPAK